MLNGKDQTGTVHHQLLILRFWRRSLPPRAVEWIRMASWYCRQAGVYVLAYRINNGIFGVGFQTLSHRFVECFGLEWTLKIV